jgi:hypothetical protein
MLPAWFRAVACGMRLDKRGASPPTGVLDVLRDSGSGALAFSRATAGHAPQTPLGGLCGRLGAVLGNEVTSVPAGSAWEGACPVGIQGGNDQVLQLVARGDAALREPFSQVVHDGAGTGEQPYADLRVVVGMSLPHQSGPSHNSLQTAVPPGIPREPRSGARPGRGVPSRRPLDYRHSASDRRQRAPPGPGCSARAWARRLATWSSSVSRPPHRCSTEVLTLCRMSAAGGFRIIREDAPGFLRMVGVTPPPPTDAAGSCPYPRATCHCDQAQVGPHYERIQKAEFRSRSCPPFAALMLVTRT